MTDAPIPVLLLTGYLGAGKTTVLNHLLALPSIRKQLLALVINEFGALGVDGTQVDAGAHAKYEINKGSLFCVCTKTDFLKTLSAIAADGPDLVLIEATGIAETRDIESFLQEPHLEGRFRVQANVCLVDALNFPKLAPNLKAARSQVAWADGLVINKSDLVPPAEVERLQAVLATYNDTAPVTVVEYGRIPAAFLQGLTHTIHEGAPVTEPPASIFSESFKTDRPVDPLDWRAALDRLGENILRLKGHVHFADRGLRFVEVVCGEQIEKDPLPSSKGETAFAVIAWNMQKKALRCIFLRCWDEPCCTGSGASADACCD